MDFARAKPKSRGILPPLTWSPSLPEGGWVCANFIVFANYFSFKRLLHQISLYCILNITCTKLKLRGLLPPLTRSPSLPEGGKELLQTPLDIQTSRVLMYNFIGQIGRFLLKNSAKIQTQAHMNLIEIYPLNYMKLYK